jgi:tRNA G18 (ribose-2'-O)-methylase SpoU
MSHKRVKTTPDLAANSPAHLAAIAAGNDHFRSWHLNVQDHFKDKTTEEIRQTLRETASPFSILIENVIGDFNISTIIRNANGFNAREVFYIGEKRFDKRGCCGVQHYKDIQFIPTVDDLIKLKEKYRFVGLDNVAGSVSMQTYKWKPNTLIIVGSEGVGITPTTQALCDDIVSIPMFGSVRSFNVGTASGIAMYSFINQIGGS